MWKTQQDVSALFDCERRVQAPVWEVFKVILVNIGNRLLQQTRQFALWHLTLRLEKSCFSFFFLFKKRSWNYREMHRKRRWSLFFFAPSRSSDAIKRDKSELQWRNKGQECAAVQFEMFCSRSAVHGKWSSCVWFTYFLSVQMNDGPLCKCSAKARRTGIRHSIYPGEEVWHAVNKSPFHNLAHRGKDVSLLFSVRWPFFPFVLEGQTDCVIQKNQMMMLEL